MKFCVNRSEVISKQWARQYSLAHWRLNEPFELPSEFMFFSAFPETTRDFERSSSNFYITLAPRVSEKLR